jgi:hypothetical protein
MAETASPEANPTQNMEDKIKLLVQENLSTTEAKLKEKVDLHTLVGFAGDITSISSNNLTIESKGNLIQITTSAKTLIQKNGSTLKFASLGIGDKIIVIGTSVKDDIVQAKRINVFKAEPVLVKTSAVVAEVVSTDTKKKTVTLTINEQDKILSLSKKSTVKIEELEQGQTILAIVKEYDGNLLISRSKVL